MTCCSCGSTSGPARLRGPRPWGAARRLAPIRKKTDEERRSQKFHELHNFASPSPVTNGKVVVVHFGNGDLGAYTLAGEQLWKRNLQDDHGPYTIWWGHANSPVIYDDLVISVCMQDSLEEVIAPPSASYVVAHDLKSGEVRWKTMRMTAAKAEECDAYTTPVLRFNLGGGWYPRYPNEAGSSICSAIAKELVVMGGNQFDAYDPETGKQAWYLPGVVGGRTVTGPTIGNDGVIYATQGMKGPLLAVKPGDGNEGQLRASEHVAWSIDKGTPDSATPVVVDRGLFTVTDDGIARCYDADTGEIRWTERIGGKYKASPIATADGRVYFLSMEGKCTVVASAGEKFEKLAENQIDDEFIASPAVSDGRIYLRGKKALWAVGDRRGG